MNTLNFVYKRKESNSNSFNHFNIENTNFSLSLTKHRTIPEKTASILSLFIKYMIHFKLIYYSKILLL